MVLRLSCETLLVYIWVKEDKLGAWIVRGIMYVRFWLFWTIYWILRGRKRLRKMLLAKEPYEHVTYQKAALHTVRSGESGTSINMEFYISKLVLSFSFNWTVTVLQCLQCCVGFCSTTTRISGSIHVFPPSGTSLPAPLQVITEHGPEFPVGCSGFLLAVHFTNGSVHMSVLPSQVVPSYYRFKTVNAWLDFRTLHLSLSNLKSCLVLSMWVTCYSSPFSCTLNRWSDHDDAKSLSHVWLCNPMDCNLPGCSVLLGFSRQEYWSGLPFPSPGDLSDPGIEPGLPHCRQTLYYLSHQGSRWSESC